MIYHDLQAICIRRQNLSNLFRIYDILYNTTLKLKYIYLYM